MTLPQALAAARGDKSQALIAEACGVSQVTISSWEAGETTPRYSRLPSIAKGYGVGLRRLQSLWIATIEAAA